MTGAAATAAALEPSVRTAGLRKRFGWREVLRGIDLEVPASGCFVVFGPNGAGKSTLLKVISTRMRPTAGRLSVLGLDPARSAGEVRAAVGVVLHESLLRGDLTLEENLRFYAGLYGLPRELARDMGAELARRFGLAARLHDPVRTFSQGMTRKATLIRSLLHRPRLWILDEPFAGLDPAGAALLEEVIAGERAAGRAVLLVTHDVELGLRLADDCLALRRGVVAARGRAEVEGFLAQGGETARGGEA